jgi:hypothetical protein
MRGSLFALVRAAAVVVAVLVAKPAVVAAEELLAPPAAGDGVALESDEGAVDPAVTAASVAPTAEEELGPVSSPAYAIHGDLRLDGQGFLSGGSLGTRVIVEGKRIGFDGGFVGVFTQPQHGSLVGRGVLDLHLAFAPVAGERGRLRLEVGLGAVFSSCLVAAGPDLGISGEVRLVGPFGLAGALHGVFWPYRLADWHLALQLTLGEYQVRAGVRHVYLDDDGRVDGVRHAESFLGPWVGVGIRL